ncbi:MAG: hypothetical protein J6W40_04680 [Alphaproteobacteria bacterium]|nr:hypothetical protein [Alphaproteobacteria bacterium]
MALKPRHKRRIGWTLVGVLAAAFIALLFVPPAITLNYMKPQLEQAVLAQTGIDAEFKGDINFSLLGRATIVAHDITVPYGTIHSVMFAVPWFSVFHPTDTELTGPISLYGAHLAINNLNAIDFKNKITLYNSVIRFRSHDYEVIRGELAHGRFNGTVRTNQHKYEVSFDNDEFVIHNQNNQLEIVGQLYSDGSARGQMSIITDDVNRWFEFPEPKINETVDLTMNFEWDGGIGFNFTDIVANNMSGNIRLYPDGRRDIDLTANDMDFDFSFLTQPNKVLRGTNLKLDFRGNIKFGKEKFKHVKINAIGTDEKLQIGSIVADDIAITGGTIDATGAHDVLVAMPVHGTNIMCLFSGTPTAWECKEYTHGNLTGSLRVNGDVFDISVTAPAKMPDITSVRNHALRFGRRGVIHFSFIDAAGTLTIDGDKMRPEFTFAKNKDLGWLGAKLPFLPKSMADSVGDFQWESGAVVFHPHDGTWQMAVQNDFFYIYGTNFKVWFPNLDLQSLRDNIYTVSGEYKNGVVSDLTINIANHVFTGSAVDGAITLTTDVLNLDSFLSQNYMEHFEEMSFLTMHPLMLPFDTDIKLSLSADKLIFDGTEYKNFVYSLKPNAQVFSVSDDYRGNILATIERNGHNYDISLQLNRFATNGKILNELMPLNIGESYITGDIAMKTYGMIAHDLEYNLNGTMDLTFTGGYIFGLGLDDFFANANKITIFDAERALAAALNDGQTRLKSLHLVGKYDQGNFETTEPLALSVPHADATGNLQIKDGKMSAQFYLVLRGTAPEPSPIDLEVLPNGERLFSLSEIMQNFDPAYMREFVKTHDRY